MRNDSVSSLLDVLSLRSYQALIGAIPLTLDPLKRIITTICDPLPWGEWTKGMCKESEILSQWYEEKDTDEYAKGTNTVLIVDVDKIKAILRVQVVKYAQIMVDYRPHEKRTRILRE